MIHINGQCTVGCPPCGLNFITKEEHTEYKANTRSLESFKELVEMLVEYGYNYFNLTPIVGEPLLVKDFLSYCDYLETHPRVKGFTFFTSLIVRRKGMIETLLSYKKLRLVISILGGDPVTFLENSGVSKFDQYCENLDIVFKGQSTSNAKLDFFIRYAKFHMKEYRIEKLIHILGSVDDNRIIPFHQNGNWCGAVPEETITTEKGWIPRATKVGVCNYIAREQCIMPNGDVILCGPTDVKQSTVIGNVNTQTIPEIFGQDSLYGDIIRGQVDGIYFDCCHRCSEFHPSSKEDFGDLKNTRPWVVDLIE